ncbi:MULTISPECIES: FAD-dependent monooxygenase [unclassified Brevibacterium]|uniref:FAD-dependent monooxygenase n=1 Tax=unclassified Brevibacterium TaxID=2614124 RepID=UPI0010931843|nr:FAD-dependent monooxygenase [Brevibacterium sp. S22]TGD32565.1 2,4-dichlorophenol 6-monooxygenase [Brevibacterium sp. S22]
MAENEQEYDAEVLVVGLGPMGATTALALAKYGVSVRAVTRQRWLADTPRAHITNLRAMEVLRSLGIEDEVKQQATPWEWMGDTLFTTSLTGPEVARMRTWGTGDQRYGDYLKSSPCTMVDIPQTVVEPILVNAAGRAGASISFNTEYLSSRQDETGVSVTLRDRITGYEYVHRYRYVVGADGAKSKVMDDAGLTVEGELARAGTVYAQFRGDLSQYVAHRPSILNWIVNEDAAVGEIGLGLLRAVHPWDHWIAGWGFDVSKGRPDLSEETARERIRAYVGDLDFEPEILSINPWYVNEAVASQYSNGRILCGGDATHRHPPSSGLGSNTCVQDAFNLAWKLAYVVNGDAGEELLTTYSAERAPVGKQIVDRANQSRRDYAPIQQALAPETSEGIHGLEKVRSDTPDGIHARAALVKAFDLKHYEFNAQGVEMNQRYVSTAVIPDDGAEPEVWERDPQLYAQSTTRPGAKIPHAWLVGENGRRVSTLDLVAGGQFTLLTGPSGRAWAHALTDLGHDWAKSIVVGDPGAEDLYLEWAQAREIDEAGAVLVRPDGTVAWRSHQAPQQAADAQAQLRDALAQVLSRPVSTHTAGHKEE